MESIPQLRQMLQTNVLGHPILQRVLSIYITRLILPTRMTANQVTIVMLVVGAVSAIPFFFGYIWTGLALSYVCIVLDASDGEVARYRKSYSLRGIYLDLINHIAIQAWFFFGLGYAIAQVNTGWVAQVVLVAAAAGALSFPLRRANGDMHRVLYVQHYAARPERYNLPSVSKDSLEFDISDKKRTGLLALIKLGIYKAEHHAIMLVIIAAALLVEMFLMPHDTAHPLVAALIIAYAAISVLYLLKEIHESYHGMDKRIAAVASRFDIRAPHEH